MNLLADLYPKGVYEEISIGEAMALAKEKKQIYTLNKSLQRIERIYLDDMLAKHRIYSLADVVSRTYFKKLAD